MHRVKAHLIQLFICPAILHDVSLAWQNPTMSSCTYRSRLSLSFWYAHATCKCMVELIE